RRPVRARRARRRPALPARTAVGYGRWRARRPGPSAAALTLRAPAVAPQHTSPTLPRLRRRGTQPRSTGRHGRVQPPSGVAPPARRPPSPARVAVPRRARTLDAEAAADAAAACPFRDTLSGPAGGTGRGAVRRGGIVRPQ